LHITITKVSLFKANNGQDPHMGFKMKKKEKFKRAKEFVTRIKEVHKKTKAMLRKSQEETKKYTNRKRSKIKEYQVGD